MRIKKSVSNAIIIIIAAMTVLGLSDLAFLSATQAPQAVQEGENSQTIPMQQINLTTSDNKVISADYFAVNEPKGWVIFSHMMPASKESWTGLAEILQGLGYAGLAIDLRGHGQSTGGPNGYQNFSDLEHQKSILDIDAAVKYLETSEKATSDKIIFIGASIGANLSLQYIAEHPEFSSAILLSPGVNYRGIEALPLAKNLKAGQRVLLIGAKDDEINLGKLASQITEIAQAIPAGVDKEIKIYDTGGHGTDILSNQPGLAQIIINYLNSGA